MPLVESPPATPFTIQVTEPTNGDENVTVCPVTSVADEGLSARTTDELLGVPELCPAVEVEGFCAGVPHPMQSANASSPMVRGLGLFRGYKLV